ncbi:MAG TPA: LysR family transcriptional regulator [Geminicoccaceae bacterium]|nr:LysR family transcriptional regulator [Geminicoccus sp.]HMU52862.1 LysR family transcriptional regulator [Geminicoccaceae bacterium]
MHAAVLRYLEEVARAGSIRQASERLNVAASAVNRQILKIEAELGVQLFERLPKGLRLTPAGELVIRHARGTLHEFDRIKGELAGLRGVKSGIVRIASLDSLFVQALPRAIESFHRRHPAVRFVVEACDPNQIAVRVAEGEADIGISFDLESHADVHFAFDVPSPICAMVAASHPLADRETTSFVECARYPLLFQPDTRPTRSAMDAELAAAKTSSRALLVANNLGMLKHMVRAGLGVAFYSRIGFVEEIARGEVVAVPLTERRISALRVGLILPRRRRPSPAVAAMTEHLAQMLAALEAGRGRMP